jgi:hypothetical protein
MADKVDNRKTIVIMDSLGQDVCDYNLPFFMVVDAQTGAYIREATAEEIINRHNKNQ